MQNNLVYFDIGTKHKEELIDPNYHFIVDNVVIPRTKEETNALTDANRKLVKYLTAIETQIFDLKKSIKDKEVTQYFPLIISAMKTKGMNYSAFCQYFNVHNMNYSLFFDDKVVNYQQRLQIIEYMVINYLKDRHEMYLSHGYSDIVLQVMSDNYSHKRKGSYGTNKIADICKIRVIPDISGEKYPNFNIEAFLLKSDKTGKANFIKFAEDYGLVLSEDNTIKYPDALIKIGKDFFIVEQKNMKEDGGGQDKQTVEITHFIKRKPEFEGLHYVTFIDGVYFNKLTPTATAKTKDQYVDVIETLAKYKSNYFVNSFAFEKVLDDAMIDNDFKKILDTVSLF